MSTNLRFHLICGAEHPDLWNDRFADGNGGWLDDVIPLLPVGENNLSVADQIKGEINNFLDDYPTGGDAIWFDHSVPALAGVFVADGGFGAIEVNLAIAACFIEFRTPGWREIPRYGSLPLVKNDYERQLRRYDLDLTLGVAIDLPGLNRRTDEGRRDRDGRDYHWWSWQWPTEVAKALYIMNRAGFCVRRQELKLMLVWTWS